VSRRRGVGSWVSLMAAAKKSLIPGEVGVGVRNGAVVEGARKVGELPMRGIWNPWRISGQIWPAGAGGPEAEQSRRAAALEGARAWGNTVWSGTSAGFRRGSVVAGDVSQLLLQRRRRAVPFPRATG
jgi:hypothetical protein